MPIFTTACVVAVAVAALLLRTSRNPLRVMGWLLMSAGLGGLGVLALAQFTGRFGPQHFWFREPTFYVAVAVLLAAAAWWLGRPAPRLLRFGLPVLVLALVGGAIVLSRVDGRSMPLAMAMPTLAVEAPGLTYVDTAGQKRSLAEMRGRVVLLNFWATWCVPCRREMPLLSRMQREHADDGLVVLYVSLEEPEVLGPFLARNSFEGIKGRLDHAADFYNAGKFYPLSYLISRDGRVAYRWSGRPKEDWLEARVGELTR